MPIIIIAIADSRGGEAPFLFVARRLATRRSRSRKILW